MNEDCQALMRELTQAGNKLMDELTKALRDLEAARGTINLQSERLEVLTNERNRAWEELLTARGERDAAYERAAQECDQLREEYLKDAREAERTGHVRYGLSQLAVARCALAIRDLKSQPTPQAGEE